MAFEEFVEDEVVDGLGGPFGMGGWSGDGGGLGREEGPMLREGGPCFDPTSEGLDFVLGEGFGKVGRRHAVAVVGGLDAAEEFTLEGKSRDDGDLSGVTGRGGAGVLIESKSGFDFGFIGTMACEAAVGKDTSCIANELGVRGGLSEGGGKGADS